MIRIAAWKRALNNDRYCGDLCAWWQDSGTLLLMIADGLGHGKYAEVAAVAARDFVADHRDLPLPALMAECNVAIRHTRGVAMGLTRIDLSDGGLVYAGIGNTRALINGETTSRLSGSYGIVGGGFRKLVAETARLRPGDLLILSTDGIRERMDLSPYGDLREVDPGELAARIGAEWSVELDDAAVLVFRFGGFGDGVKFEV